MQKNSTPLLVVAAELVDGDGRVLMQRRRLNSAHGGLWEFPGGKLEAGESPESGLLREIEEELGIDLAADALRPLSFASGPADFGPAGIVILLYICREWQGAPECRAGEELGWFAPGELGDLAMPPLDYPLASALVSALTQFSF